jgi:hypothetical protein
MLDVVQNVTENPIVFAQGGQVHRNILNYLMGICRPNLFSLIISQCQLTSYDLLLNANYSHALKI